MAAAAVSFGCYAFGAEKTSPNFVFIITDDISPDDLPCYGNDKIKTPCIDRLAKSGLVFDNAYQTISSCSPSRCSIVTGRYPHNTGAPELHTVLPSTQHTFIHDFRAAGYYTAISGKNHMADFKQLGFDRGEDSGPSGAEKWLKFLKERPKDRPFFMWFASHDAHREWQINDKAPKYAPDQVNVPPMLYDGPAERENLAGYYHEISRTDYYTALVVEELEKQGVADNTYIVYCSDNGRPFIRCKTYLYESGIKTPLIINGPDVKAGRTDSLVSSIDYSATFLELAGIKKPGSVQGVSFCKVLTDPSHVSREVAFAERNWHVMQLHERMVRTGDWLYIWNAFPHTYNVCGESAFYNWSDVKEFWQAADDGKLNGNQMKVTSADQPEELLFNVRKDPYQFSDLSKEPAHKAQLEMMRKLLAQWKAQTGDNIPDKPTPDRQQLHGEQREEPFFRGDVPGAKNNATEINECGPVMLADV
jgi:arylsulfatase